MSRRDAREAAFMLLYQIEIQKGEEERQLADFIEQREIHPGDVPYLTLLFDGVRARRESLDAIFTPYLKRWTKSRLPKIDLTILRLAVFEICHMPEVPDNVAISEAVLLARKFSSEESRSYINAVLGRMNADQVREAGREPAAGADEAEAGITEPDAELSVDPTLDPSVEADSEPDAEPNAEPAAEPAADAAAGRDPDIRLP